MTYYRDEYETNFNECLEKEDGVDRTRRKMTYDTLKEHSYRGWREFVELYFNYRRHGNIMDER
jgi:hypothetical protein